MTVIKKYLKNYAENEIEAVQGMPFYFRNVLIIPAYNESDQLINTLESVKEKNTLVILVVNSTADCSEAVQTTNKKTLSLLRKTYFNLWRSTKVQGVSLHQMPNCSLLIVDKHSGALKLPVKKGVGLARKIAADIALKLIDDKKIDSTWIHSTDADVELPKEYFVQTTQSNSDCVAAIYQYEHEPESEQTSHEQAVFLYELSLRHYVIGLQHASSPYAFHTIGSTIAVKADAYAAVRGFPKREAGEDFYLLNKLVKIGSIERLTGPAIKIAGRVSDRVPFGTGKAVQKIQNMTNPIEEFTFYNPIIFELLKIWHFEIQKLSPVSNLKKFEKTIREKIKYPQFISGLEKLGAFQAIKNILKKTYSKDSSLQQIHTWFDGLRTLKLIHHMRDHGLPNMNLNELLTHPFYQHHKIKNTDNLDNINNHFILIESRT